MESGLEGRNNSGNPGKTRLTIMGLNGVRPRRPEQSGIGYDEYHQMIVSMESGLEGRNNLTLCALP